MYLVLYIYSTKVYIRAVITHKEKELISTIGAKICS